ncbi:MAG: UDP-glucose/GDP-mannose dehydrogenase family protein [Anaerolineales bacterium]|nr:UDP-glucose/GDP-mannose dehydrogenase family protein [Anaerolineales bacterium]
MKNICVIGVGYVGIITAACFADLGNNVVALDIDQEKIAGLKKGKMPIYEPGLKELVDRNVEANRIHFTNSYEEGLKDAEFAFIAVGTPSGVDGEADLQYVASAARSIADHIKKGLIIINKSTVPVGTGDWVADIVKEQNPNAEKFAVVSCPEFLREGSAISDFMQPHRIVVGSLDAEAADKVAQLHLSLRAPIVVTDLRTAEMIKYASNAFLATKISFINEIADICEDLGADVMEVSNGMGFDSRIGPSFLHAGIGYGGSCFPKDVKALAFMAEEKGRHPQLLHSVMEINTDRRVMAVEQVKSLLGSKDLSGKTIGMLGLSFKPNTDDMRDAPSVTIANLLINDGATIRAFDPIAMEEAAKLIPGVEMVENPYKMAEGCDLLMVNTEWNEFRQLDLKRIKEAMKEAVLFDGRNIYDPGIMAELGFRYRGVGRGYNGR